MLADAESRHITRTALPINQIFTCTKHQKIKMQTYLLNWQLIRTSLLAYKLSQNGPF